MSDISSRDLRPGLDYTYDNDHILFSWKEFEPQCSLATDDGGSGSNQGFGYNGASNYGQPGTAMGRPVVSFYESGVNSYRPDSYGPAYSYDHDTHDNHAFGGYPRYPKPDDRGQYPSGKRKCSKCGVHFILVDIW